ncbi:hypothetical protein HI914_07545 [Erysiphe necator]|nr:hypothetical protein HI914_07545 [Erysiphe necator]
MLLNIAGIVIPSNKKEAYYFFSCKSILKDFGKEISVYALFAMLKLAFNSILVLRNKTQIKSKSPDLKAKVQRLDFHISWKLKIEFATSFQLLE